MAEHRFDLRPHPTGEHLEQVRRALGSLGDGDVVHRVAERLDGGELDPFVRLFAEHGFGIRPKGGHDGEYHPYARRALPRPASRTGPYAES